MFRCSHTSSCIHYNDLCNNKRDCLHGEDEMLCDLTSCPKYCSCLLYAITCSSNEFKLDTLVKRPYRYAFIRNNSLGLYNMDAFRKIIVLKLQNDSLGSFCLRTQKHTNSLKGLDLSFNRIVYNIHDRDCFKPFPNMLILNLTNNAIQTLTRFIFNSLSNLNELDLSSNPILIFNQATFSRLTKLTILVLIHLHITYIEKSTFALDNLKLIFTDDFHICCFASIDTYCTSKIRWPFRCGDLLGSHQLQTCLWFLSLLIIFLNGISIWLCARTIYLDKSILDKPKTYPITVLVLNIGDLLNGFHLITIASADAYYGLDYITLDIEWRSGFLCNFVSNLSLFANLITMYSLILLAASRLCITINPLNTKVLSKKFILKVILLGMICSLSFVFIAISLQLAGSGGKMIQPVPLCIAYGTSLKGSSSITLVYGFFQILAVFTIILIHIFLIISLKKIDRKNAKLHRDQIPTDSSKNKASRNVLFQLIAVSTSNIVCWLPLSILLWSAVLSDQFPISLLFWVVLILTPINSCLNPCFLQFNVNLNKLRACFRTLSHDCDYSGIQKFMSHLRGYFWIELPPLSTSAFTFLKSKKSDY